MPTDESEGIPSTGRLRTLVAERDLDAATVCLGAFETATIDERKEAVQTLRTLADDDPEQLDGLVAALVPFLEDDQRAVRLSTAKVLVTVAQTEPDAVRPVVAAVADRLADEKEFYYVRARCAETLGYVALEHPDEVSSPEILADLRVGLAFDEPEVKEKLAKALEYVAVGDPQRLRHQVSNLAEHLDDDGDLVRYHLCTALVAVGASHPAKLADATEPLVDRLGDSNPYVRGRAAEALGLLARSDTDTGIRRTSLDDLVNEESGDTGVDAEAEFVIDRATFARAGVAKVPAEGDTEFDSVGSLDSIRASTERAVEAMTTPDADGDCPHCGLELPEHGPPMCPRCGTPR